MRSYQVFAQMAPEQAEALLRELNEKSPAVFQQAVLAACAAMKARPTYLKKQPFDKRAAAVRRALSRVAANALAEEILAAYFLECRKELLTEWLDAIGIKHEDGMLKEDAPTCPDAKKLATALQSFRKSENAADRELLLRAFAAQSSVDWPELEALLGSPAPH